MRVRPQLSLWSFSLLCPTGPEQLQEVCRSKSCLHMKMIFAKETKLCFLPGINPFGKKKISFKQALLWITQSSANIWISIILLLALHGACSMSSMSSCRPAFSSVSGVHLACVPLFEDTFIFFFPPRGDPIYLPWWSMHMKWMKFLVHSSSGNIDFLSICKWRGRINDFNFRH